METERKEQYRVFATIEVLGSEQEDISEEHVEQVLCKVFLPFRKTEKPLLHFIPTDEQERHLQSPALFKVHAELTQPNGELTVISADQVQITHHTGTGWGPDLNEHLLIGAPWGLKIEHIREPSSFYSAPRTTGSFWISPNKLLSNVGIRHFDYKGHVDTERYERLTLRITLANGWPITFEVNTGFRNRTERETVMFDEFAAEVQLPVDTCGTSTIHEALSQIEDVLRRLSTISSNPHKAPTTQLDLEKHTQAHIRQIL